MSDNFCCSVEDNVDTDDVNISQFGKKHPMELDSLSFGHHVKMKIEESKAKK